MIDRQEVYEAIDGERDYQSKAWPEGDNQSLGEFILMIEEYTSLARKQWRELEAPEVEAFHTLRKIAAICVQCMERHGAPKR